MRFEIITIFPGFFAGFLEHGIVRRAQAEGLVTVGLHDLRNFTHDRHRTVDDRPFGGGPGMLLKPGPIFEAVESLKRERTRVVLMSPSGRKFDQSIARELAQQEHLLIVTGHYEGFDERIREALANDELSIGDYVLTNGALPAMVVIDTVIRLLPGVLGEADSLSEESFEDQLLEHPQYTRPRTFEGLDIPEVLLSGHHGAVARWRRTQREATTRERRPDLWALRSANQQPKGE